MSKFGKELIESMQQAAKRAAGKKVRGLRVSKVELPDVKAIRVALRMSPHHSRRRIGFRFPS
jgi:putative transcriptional regulator